VLAVVPEPLAHGAARERRKILEGCGLGCGGCNDNCVLECIVLLECLHELGNGRPLLADGDVDAIELVAIEG
jgi:hypothetical protein